MRSRAPLVVYVPTELALVFTAARGWYLASPAPAWWYDELEAECSPTYVDVVSFGARRRLRRAAQLRPAPVKPSLRRRHRWRTAA